MAWNKPSGAPKPVQKKPSAMRGVVAGLVVAALAAACVLVFMGKGEKPVGKVEKKPTKIKEVKPASSPKPVKVEEKVEKATDAAKPPIEKAKKAPKQPVGYQRVMTLMDGTVVTNKYKAIFKRPFENILAASMRPTGTGRTLLLATWKQYGDTAFLEMLKEMTVPEEGDSANVRRIKEDVQKLKESILLEVSNGRSLESIFADISHNNSMDRMVNAQTIRMQSEAVRSGDPESVRAATEAVNAMRRQRGLADLEVPHRFRQNDDWGVVPDDSSAEAAPEAEAVSQ